MSQAPEKPLYMMEFPPFDAWRGIPDELRPPKDIEEVIKRSITEIKEKHKAKLVKDSLESLRLGQRFSAQENIRHNPMANIYDLRGLELMTQS